MQKLHDICMFLELSTYQEKFYQIDRKRVNSVFTILFTVDQVDNQLLPKLSISRENRLSSTSKPIHFVVSPGNDRNPKVFDISETFDKSTTLAIGDRHTGQDVYKLLAQSLQATI